MLELTAFFAKTGGSRVHTWVRGAFFVWAAVSTLWLANSMRTRGVPDELLRSSAAVTVVENDATLQFLRSSARHESALIFICGSGVAAQAYAPLLRPVAEAGFDVYVVKLPYRFAFFESHKQEALRRVRDIMATHSDVGRWVVSGHSLGAALACRVKADEMAGLVLIGTTHPKERSLARLTIPVTKVYGSNDGVAPPDRMHANAKLLPPHTKWVEIRGGNHSQFGHYGRQLMDGKAAITRQAQQAATRSALLEMLRNSSGARPGP